MLGIGINVVKLVDVYDFTSQIVDVAHNNPILERFVLSRPPGQVSAVGAGNQMPRSAPAQP